MGICPVDPQTLTLAASGLKIDIIIQYTTITIGNLPAKKKAQPLEVAPIFPDWRIFSMSLSKKNLRLIFFNRG